MKCDIFISYRRVGGDTTAKALHHELKKHGYRAFFDVDSLGAGEYPNALASAIRECTDFLLVLSPGALDRCNNEDDWVRLEVEEALRGNKNIVPVIMNGFVWPETLPESLCPLTSVNGVELNGSYFFEGVDRLRKRFLNSRPTVSPKRILLSLFAAAAVLTAALGFSGLMDIPGVPSPVRETERPAWVCLLCGADNAGSLTECGDCGAVYGATPSPDPGWVCQGCHTWYASDCYYCAVCALVRNATPSPDPGWFCAGCGSWYASTDEVCEVCGISRDATPSPVPGWTCMACGRWNRDELEVCYSCGLTKGTVPESYPPIDDTPLPLTPPISDETSAPTPTVTGESAYVITTMDINLRSGPGLEYDIVTSFSKGKKLPYMGQTVVDSRGIAWFAVEYRDTTAWLSERYSELRCLDGETNK